MGLGTVWTWGADRVTDEVQTGHWLIYNSLPDTTSYMLSIQKGPSSIFRDFSVFFLNFKDQIQQENLICLTQLPICGQYTLRTCLPYIGWVTYILP